MFSTSVSTPTGILPPAILLISTATPEIPPGAMPLGSRNKFRPRLVTNAPATIKAAFTILFFKKNTASLLLYPYAYNYIIAFCRAR